MEMETIKEECNKLSEKNSHVRSGLYKFLKEFGEATKGIHITTKLEAGKQYIECLGIHLHHCLGTGVDDLLIERSDGSHTYIEERESYAHSELPIKIIREIIAELPDAIERIREEVAESDTANDEAIESLLGITFNN